MRQASYKRYSDKIRSAVARSGNANLFPELNIPKSTAYQWIKESMAKSKRLTINTDKEVAAADIREFLEAIIGIVDFRNLDKGSVHQLRDLVLKKELCSQTWLPKALGKRLFKLFSPCLNSSVGSCLRRYPNQISDSELKKMRQMAISPKYAHMSTCSLALLAKRQGIVTCGVHTWYKYLAKQKWQRPSIKVCKPKRRTVGLHAQHPHEYWHQDVTKIRVQDGSKQCLQVIQDNCSRAILSWRISSTVKARDSDRLLIRAKRSLVGQNIHSTHLVVDGGPENVGIDARLSYKKCRPRILSRIARKEIRFANTMVEVFFKGLKSYFLRGKEFRDAKDLTRAVAFYIRQYNEVIPRLALGGRTPHEVLAGVSRSDVDDKGIEESERKIRVLENKKRICRKCVSCQK